MLLGVFVLLLCNKESGALQVKRRGEVEVRARVGARRSPVCVSMCRWVSEGGLRQTIVVVELKVCGDAVVGEVVWVLFGTMCIDCSCGC